MTTTLSAIEWYLAGVFSVLVPSAAFAVWHHVYGLRMQIFDLKDALAQGADAKQQTRVLPGAATYGTGPVGVADVMILPTDELSWTGNTSRAMIDEFDWQMKNVPGIGKGSAMLAAMNKVMSPCRLPEVSDSTGALREGPYGLELAPAMKYAEEARENQRRERLLAHGQAAQETAHVPATEQADRSTLNNNPFFEHLEKTPSSKLRQAIDALTEDVLWETRTRPFAVGDKVLRLDTADKRIYRVSEILKSSRVMIEHSNYTWKVQVSTLRHAAPSKLFKVGDVVHERWRKAVVIEDKLEGRVRIEYEDNGECDELPEASLKMVVQCEPLEVGDRVLALKTGKILRVTGFVDDDQYIVKSDDFAEHVVPGWRLKKIVEKKPSKGAMEVRL